MRAGAHGGGWHYGGGGAQSPYHEYGHWCGHFHYHVHRDYQYNNIITINTYYYHYDGGGCNNCYDVVGGGGDVEHYYAGIGGLWRRR